jgi:DNA-directed RNA polymerase specialized sigma24 family protein
MAAMIGARAFDYVRTNFHSRSKRVRFVRSRATWSFDLTDALHEEPFHSHINPHAHDDPAQEVEHDENWNHLLAQLKDDWKRFVRLRFWEGLSSSQIARSSGCTPRTVNRTLHSALLLIHDSVREDWEAL